MQYASLVLAVMTALWLAGPARAAGPDAGEQAAVRPRELTARAGPDRKAWPRRWQQCGRWALALLAVASLVADTQDLQIGPRSDIPSFIATGSYRRYIRPGETVAVISNVGNAGMLWQADTGFYLRLAGGYTSQMLTPHSDLPRQIQNLDIATPQHEQQFLAFVRRARIGAILVDADAAPGWATVLAKFGWHGKLAGGVLVYQIDGRPGGAP
jgi:hypothetical protein